MSPHKKIYFDAMGLDEGDTILCECCGKIAVDVHAIISDGMGGRPNKETHRIENLMALARDCHDTKGHKKQWRGWLFRVHRNFLKDNGILCDLEWIDEQLKKCS